MPSQTYLDRHECRIAFVCACHLCELCAIIQVTDTLVRYLIRIEFRTVLTVAFGKVLNGNRIILGRVQSNRLLWLETAFLRLFRMIVGHFFSAVSRMSVLNSFLLGCYWDWFP
jgi:hypothetical protein